MHALSLRQPWAALLASGRKSIEVRRWRTSRRERILIHAARAPDERPEAWLHVTPELLVLARMTGGIVGAGHLTVCRTYRSARAFAADQAQHLNRPEWFAPPRLYGFVFSDLEVLSFRPYPGGMRFFAVEEKEQG